MTDTTENAVYNIKGVPAAAHQHHLLPGSPGVGPVCQGVDDG